MKIYLIRHGETTGDLEDRFGGDYDDHLTEAGKSQSKELVEDLRGKKIEAIFISPKIRAVETAKETEDLLGISSEIVNDLRERNNYGVLTGLTKVEAQEKHPEEFEKISRDKIHHDVSGSESYEDTKVRVRNVFGDILSKKYDSIAIISHGGIISTYVREFLTGGQNVKLGDCAILELTKEGDNISIDSFKRAELC